MLKLIHKFLSIGTHGPQPHNLKAGLKRVPVHLTTFGIPSLIVCLLIPPGPWKWIPAGILIAQAVRGEIDDVQNNEDTIGKAIVDGISQTALAILGGIL